MNTDLIARVERACVNINEEHSPVTFAEVAARVGTSKATLYRRAELRSIIEEHRTHNREAHTLTGLVVELDQLRHALEAVAAKVRHHEEVLRNLQRRANTTK
jgi:DNA-binding Lrp family transcriptional regulator